jgi:ACS family allantoate permease-like MFS transporter
MASATDNATVPEREKETAIMDDSLPQAGLRVKINEKLAKHSHDADAALKAFEGREGQVLELSEEKSKALLRKIDWHLMPVCGFRLLNNLVLRSRRSCASYTGSTTSTKQRSATRVLWDSDYLHRPTSYIRASI